MKKKLAALLAALLVLLLATLPAAAASEDIPFDKIGHENNIGITAGASTPDSLIQEVKKAMS